LRRWTSPDRDRPLSSEGHLAVCSRGLLHRWIDAVFSGCASRSGILPPFPFVSRYSIAFSSLPANTPFSFPPDDINVSSFFLPLPSRGRSLISSVVSFSLLGSGPFLPRDKHVFPSPFLSVEAFHFTGSFSSPSWMPTPFLVVNKRQNSAPSPFSSS